MTVGRTVTTADVNETMADLASRLLSLLHDQEELQRWNVRTPQGDLQDPAKFTPPLSADDAFLVKTVLDRLQQASTWLHGGSLPPDTHDTVSDLSKFVGMGAIGS